MKLNSDNQCRTMWQAIKNEGHRIVYNKKTGSFEDVSFFKAKMLSLSSDYITDLPGLQNKIREFVNEYPLGDFWRSTLADAFKEKVDALKRRDVLLEVCERKRNAAVDHLKTIRNILVKPKEKQWMTTLKKLVGEVKQPSINMSVKEWLIASLKNQELGPSAA